MARGIEVRWNGEVSRFGLTKVDREKLYGAKSRVAVDGQGRDCVPAWMTSDGTSLVMPGGLAYVYVDDAFDTVERSALKAVDAAGAPVVTQPSTLGVPQDLLGPVSPDRVLDCVTDTVYELSPEELHPDLQAALDAGKIFETVFAWRDAYTYSVAFLLKSGESYFSLIATPHNLALVDKAAPAPEVEADEDDAELGDELDFSMM